MKLIVTGVPTIHVAVDTVFPVDDPYCERFWLPVVGPTAFLVLRRLAAEVNEHGAVDIDLDDFATWFGVTPSVVKKAMDRLVAFRCAKSEGVEYRVALHLPPVYPGQVARFTTSMQERHRAWQATDTGMVA